MPKQTRLNENAEIYQQRKDQSEKEKLSEMDFKKKVSYLWEYYKLHALVTVIIIATGAYIVKEIVTPNIETKLYAAVINNSIEPQVLEEYQQAFSEYLQLDPTREEVNINPQFYMNGDTEYSMNMKQVLGAYVAAQDVDIIIAPKSDFETYSYYGYMEPMSDLLPTDLYSSLSNYFYIGTQEENPEENVYGIYLSEAGLFKDNAKFTEDNPYVLGVIANSRRQNNAVEFIRYLFK